MSRIEDKYLDCSVYLYPTGESAKNGERAGGCGFLVAVPASGTGWLLDGRCPQHDYHHCYVLSNRHVAEKHPVVRLNTQDNRFDVIPFAPDDWTLSDKHDLAVCTFREFLTLRQPDRAGG